MDRPNKPSSISAPRNDPQAQVDASSDRITAKLPSGDSCEISLHGATVISWKSGGRENIWLSENAVMDGSKAIRGGVPVCFPVSASFALSSTCWSFHRTNQLRQ
jgi:glucose-6-phosphate 1-epimerase